MAAVDAGQAVARPAALADRRARPARPHGAPAADPGRARRPDGDLQADVSESVRRLSEAGLRGRHRRTNHRPRAGRLVLRPRRGPRQRTGVSVAPEGVVAETLDAHGDVICTATADVATRRHSRRRSCEAIRRRGRGSPAGLRAGPGSRWSARPTRWTGPPDGWCTCPTAPVPARRPVPADCWPTSSTARSLVDNDVNWAARAERDAADAAVRRLRLRPPGRGPGLRGRQRRRGPPRARRSRRRDRPRPHPRPGRPRHPVHRGVRRAPPPPPGIDGDRRRRPARQDRHAGGRRTRCGRWPAPSAASSPQRSPSPTPRSSSSAAPGAPSLRFSRH